ncbi:glycoside hydrolase family 9 protein [Herbivorax sp. ANBcel31]|uniref:glycoside hydrolase family 9 protein n=1 Tax=Herbivorax sp. ANBcel31 TaxID=3069754 RepID=UPI0027AECC22|nr:glycoside hydrolase family 9 protein [Herbivorax sp. ANBcel31]MDQ2086156.1 glycoside hydrolase family 9 protein [Herbivorax sp. ANBcel31]
MVKKSLALFLVFSMVVAILVPQVLANTETYEEGVGGEEVELSSFKYGDLDGDLEITSSDYAIIRKHILYEDRITDPDVFKAGDLNGDGSIDTTDATLLGRYILEIIDEFPVEKEADSEEPEFITENTENVGDWTLYNLSHTDVEIEESSSEGAEVSIAQTGTSEDDIQLKYNDSFDMDAGEYELSLSFEGDGLDEVRSGRVVLEKDDMTREVILDEVVSVTLLETSKTVEIPFTVTEDLSANFSIRLGYFEGEDIDSHEIKVSSPTVERTGDYEDSDEPEEVVIDPDRFNNRVSNGDFSDGTTGWWSNECTLAVEDGVGAVELEGGSEDPWDVMIGYHHIVQLDGGVNYEVSFDIASDIDQDIRFQIVNDDEEDAEVFGKSISVSGEDDLVTYTFDDFETNDDFGAKFAFQFGSFGEEEEIYNIYIDNVQIKEIPNITYVEIDNADFSGRTNAWWNTTDTCDFTAFDGYGEIEIEGGTENPWDVMVGNWRAFDLEEDKEYTISFEIASEIEQTAIFQIVDSEKDEDENEMYSKSFTIPEGTTLQTIVLDDLEVEESYRGMVEFQLGSYGEEGETYFVYLDNVEIFYIDYSSGGATINPYDNMVRNADFSSGTNNWGMHDMSHGEASFDVEDEEAVINVTNTGTEDYSVQFYQDGIRLYEGNKYEFSFRYKANEERDAEIRIQENGGDYIGYLDDSLTLTDEWQTYEKEFTMEYEDDIAARLCFNLGEYGDETEVDQMIYFDDFNLVMTEGTIPEEERENPIRLNQVGYRPNDDKVAFVVSDERTFRLYTEDDQLVLTGNLSLYSKDSDGNPVVDASSGDITLAADFSSFAYDGDYYVQVRNDKSPVFGVNENVYDEVTEAVLKLFYYQRSGELKEEYVGELFAREAAHTEKAIYYDPTDPLYGDVEIDVHGGWYDAGDYGRYITPAAKAVADLMMTAEHFPSTQEIDFGGPDKLLAETQYELEWMLKMQHPETGGVYHKVTGQYHASMTVLPQDDDDQLYLAPVSAPATGDFAAVMAYAYRLYKDIDQEFAQECLDAAILAWEWLEENPDIDGYTDPVFFHSGAYNDNNSSDERYWAAAELYKVTEDQEYLEYMENNVLPRAGFGWRDMGSYALVALLTTDHIDEESDLYQAAKDRFIDDAQGVLEVWEEDGYKVALDYYVWGSNKDLADRTMMLIFADKLQPNPKYKEAVLDQLHYFLGRNASDISYVTGYGEKSAQNPHHRPSVILGETVPGMLVGGPNNEIMDIEGDPVSQMVDDNTPPARRYADITGSYATNEICIYWNSPLAYVLGYIYE